MILRTLCSSNSEIGFIPILSLKKLMQWNAGGGKVCGFVQDTSAETVLWFEPKHLSRVNEDMAQGWVLHVQAIVVTRAPSAAVITNGSAPAQVTCLTGKMRNVYMK